MSVLRRLAPSLALLVSLLLLFPSVARAHIGSPTVVLDATAGPYPVRVVVRPPQVIPGLASIDVRFLDDEKSPRRVTVLPVESRAGLQGAPAPDEATPVVGDTALRHAELWLMTFGAYSVHVVVTGERGEGRLIVPVDAVATRQLPMPFGLGAILAVIGCVLFVSAVTLVSVGVKESTLHPSAQLDTASRRGSIIAAVIATALFAVLLYWGKGWWDREDSKFRNNQIYRPQPMIATPRIENGRRIVSFSFKDRDGKVTRPPSLLPDHGKLMHLFLLREPALDVFAHVHPMRNATGTFELVTPPLPAGTYRLYADITYESGFAATLTCTTALPEIPPAIAAQDSRAGIDSDDSWFIESAEKSAAGEWIVSRTDSKPLVANEPLSLNFAIKGRDGTPASLEPYMGMMGHAAVRRSDGSVFAHLHPTGTISMAAQMLFEKQIKTPDAASAAPVDHSMHQHHVPAVSTVKFPYEFPQGGKYRVWVQTKVEGEVVTGVFDLEVADSR